MCPRKLIPNGISTVAMAREMIRRASKESKPLEAPGKLSHLQRKIKQHVYIRLLNNKIPTTAA